MSTTEHNHRQGIVVKKTLGKYTVRSAEGSAADSRPIGCALAGNLSKQLMFSTANPTSMRKRVLEVKDLDTVDPVAVGDRVTYQLNEDGTRHDHRDSAAPEQTLAAGHRWRAAVQEKRAASNR